MLLAVPLGPSLTAMPDGEVGPRKHWISKVHYQVLSGHPELETVRRPQPDNGVERLNPRNAADSWLFKVKDGVERVRFCDPGWRLGYARDAINSYFVFKTLREKGVLPKHLRFQVSLPSVNSALPPRIFPNPADVGRIRPGFTDAMAAEIGTIVEKIPHDDLAIQWDCATEVQDAYGAIPGLPADGAIERNIEQFRRLSSLIPETVLLGYHFCFGTLGGWPRFAPPDLSATVALANAVNESSGRRVDWMLYPGAGWGQRRFFRSFEGFAATQRPGLPRPRPSHGGVRGTLDHRSEISARLRSCGILRIWPSAPGSNTGGSRRASASNQGCA